MHFCQDEVAAALTLLEHAGQAWVWLKNKYRTWRSR